MTILTLVFSVTGLLGCSAPFPWAMGVLAKKRQQHPQLISSHKEISHLQDKKDFVVKRVKRLLKAGIISALTCMVKADSTILTDQTKEMLARSVLI